MHVLHPAPLGALPLEGNYPKPPGLNSGAAAICRGVCPWNLFSFVSFHFGLLGLHFTVLGLQFVDFSLLGLHFLSFWPFAPSFPFILAFWAFISFHFDPFGAWGFISFILAFWTLVSFHFGLLSGPKGPPVFLLELYLVGILECMMHYFLLRFSKKTTQP